MVSFKARIALDSGKLLRGVSRHVAGKKNLGEKFGAAKTKRLLLHYPLLNVGGAEKSSLRMIEALADRGWQVTLVLTTGGGCLEREIDPRVEIVRLRPRGYGSRFSAAPTIVGKFATIGDLVAYASMRLVGAWRMLPFLFRKYDAAAVLIHSSRSTFVRHIVRARTKIHWIRNDLERVDPEGRLTRRLAAVDAGIDWYICVSEGARQSLHNRLPQVANKTIVVYNILNTEQMHESSRSDDPFPQRTDGELRILTVGRLLDRDKGLFRLARLCRRLADAGFKFRWFLIGSGPDEAKLRSLIDELGVRDHLLLLGPKTNPFPYYRYADLIAVLSYHEGLCGVINEAKVAGCAVLATNFAGVREQLSNGENGWIIPNDEEAIATFLAQLLNEPSLIKRTQNHTYPEIMLDDDRKLDLLEELFMRKSIRPAARG
jgi:glycosyltransferase involved in cell wall biosynthesis